MDSDSNNENVMEEKIRTLIVDDEKASREVLCSLLGNYCPEIELVSEASSADEAYREILLHKPELVFLDIQMPRADGFSLLQRFATIPFKTVFITGFGQYAINAIKFSALDYLLKPVEVDDLKEAVAKVMATRENPEHGVQIINLLYNLTTGDADSMTVGVHVGEKVKLLKASEIEYIEGEGRYSRISVLENLSYLTAKNLKEYEDYLGQGSSFIRIGKSCILNVNHIAEYGKGEPCIIEMKSGRTFEVSRRKKQEVLEKIRSANK